MKFVATVLLAASAALFAPSAIPQGTQNAMALSASAPSEISRVAVQAGNAVATPVGFTSARMLGDATRSDDASWKPSLKGPEPAFAWVFALGFLGLVITRRIRNSSQF
ncbi:MAG TPA: hypothetical protein VM122_01460 [Usitatibacter sp.]|nr:hypothetical protein [Usitatibacter sp.]